MEVELTLPLVRTKEHRAICLPTAGQQAYWKDGTLTWAAASRPAEPARFCRAADEAESAEVAVPPMSLGPPDGL